jgi:hypothetical protein
MWAGTKSNLQKLRSTNFIGAVFYWCRKMALLIPSAKILEIAQIILDLRDIYRTKNFFQISKRLEFSRSYLIFSESFVLKFNQSVFFLYISRISKASLVYLLI